MNLKKKCIEGFTVGGKNPSFHKINGQYTAVISFKIRTMLPEIDFRTTYILLILFKSNIINASFGKV